MSASASHIVDCPDQAATEAFAVALAMCLRAGDVVALSGTVGAGKSTLARAAIRSALGDLEADVPSPTFTLVQTYEDARPFPILHADFYRLSDVQEADELGLDEALEIGAILVEWPDQVPGLLPRRTFDITIQDYGRNDTDGHSRRLIILADDADWKRLKRSLLINAFLAKQGYGEGQRAPLTGDASTRAYETVMASGFDGAPPIVMNAPRQPDGPPIKDGKPYSRIAHLAEDVSAFVGVTHILEDAGFKVPRIIASDLENGFLLCENLGQETPLLSDGTPDPHRYGWAAETLAAIAERVWSSTVTFEGDKGIQAEHTIPTYDKLAMSIEVDLLPKWFAPWRMSSELSRDAAADFASIWDDLIARLEDQPKTLVLRDFHSPNIIWCPDEEGIRQIGLIDFQDAVIGPTAYDVASLAQDARVHVPADLEAELISRYLKNTPSQDRDLFEEGYAIMAAQRATKILGIFVRLSKRDGKDAYLAHIPRIEAVLSRTLNHPVLAPYKTWFNTVLKT
ncbi:MAG: tRNA (adenosine(37)-N6)-threonylcarbamoyltransferase complex ATPase subunit type 1 TsaE [Pseudomonadota bacterium]